MADIEAPTHENSQNDISRQQVIANNGVGEVIVDLRTGRNFIRNFPRTLMSLVGTRFGIEPKAAKDADTAYESVVKAIEISSRKGAVVTTETFGPGMTGEPRNNAYFQRISTRVADGLRVMLDDSTTRAIEDNKGLGIFGRGYRAALANPAETFATGIVLVALTAVAQRTLDPNVDINTAIYGLRTAGEFLLAYPILSDLTKVLVDYHSRHARNLSGATTADLLARAAAWNEERAVHARNYPKSDAENEVIGQLTDNTGQAVFEELKNRKASLPTVIQTTVGVPETVAGINNALNEKPGENPLQLWLEKMVEQRRARFLVFAGAALTTAAIGWYDITGRPPFIGSVPAQNPIVRTVDTTQTATVTHTLTEISNPTPTPTIIVDYFVNPDNNFDPLDKGEVSLTGYAQSLVANVDFEWNKKFGHDFNASADDMKKLDKLIGNNRALYDYRVGLYADAERRRNAGRNLIHGDRIDRYASNVPDGMHGIIRLSDEELLKLQ